MSSIYIKTISAPRISRNGRIYTSSSVSQVSSSSGGAVPSGGVYMTTHTFGNSDLSVVGYDRILTITHNLGTNNCTFTVWDNNNEEVVGVRKVKTSSNEAKIYINDVISGIWSVNITYTV